jgi:hypothetical protein
MRTVVFGLLVVLTVPTIAFTAIVPVYAMLLHGQALSAPTAVIAIGLDQGWLFVLVVTSAICGFKISLPTFIYGLRPGGTVRTVVCLFIWLLALATSSSAMFMAAVHLLPADVPNELIRALMVAWPVLDIMSALLPIVVMGPAEPDVGPQNAPVSKDQKPETRPEPLGLDGLEQEVVWLLMDIEEGHYFAGTHLSTSGDILTTQRALGQALDLSAATVNRILKALAVAGRIRLTTSPKGTCIRLL